MGMIVKQADPLQILKVEVEAKMQMEVGGEVGVN
jgi:hypothetical protein